MPRRRAGRATRLRRWCFTLNVSDDYERRGFETRLEAPTVVRYAIFQEEKAPSTGQRHFQGYVQLLKAFTLGQLKRFLNEPTIHLEPQLAPKAIAAIDYCRAEHKRIPGTEVFEYGTPARQAQGLQGAVEAAREGQGIRSIANEFSIEFVKHPQGLTKLAAMNTPARDWEMKIFICYGETGTGKSSWSFWKAKNEFGGDFYVIKEPCGGRWWWPNYNGEEVAIFDDFSCSRLKRLDLMTLMDRYEMKIEFKGGMTQFRSKVLIITTNEDPKDWYIGLSDEKKAPLGRRIKDFAKILHFTAPPDWSDPEDPKFFFEEVEWEGFTGFRAPARADGDASGDQMNQDQHGGLGDEFF